MQESHIKNDGENIIFVIGNIMNSPPLSGNSSDDLFLYVLSLVRRRNRYYVRIIIRDDNRKKKVVKVSLEMYNLLFLCKTFADWLEFNFDVNKKPEEIVLNLSCTRFNKRTLVKFFSCKSIHELNMMILNNHDEKLLKFVMFMEYRPFCKDKNFRLFLMHVIFEREHLLLSLLKNLCGNDKIISTSKKLHEEVLEKLEECRHYSDISEDYCFEINNGKLFGNRKIWGGEMLYLLQCTIDGEKPDNNVLQLKYEF